MGAIACLLAPAARRPCRAASSRPEAGALLVSHKAHDIRPGPLRRDSGLAFPRPDSRLRLSPCICLIIFASKTCRRCTR